MLYSPYRAGAKRRSFPQYAFRYGCIVNLRGLWGKLNIINVMLVLLDRKSQSWSLSRGINGVDVIFVFSLIVLTKWAIVVFFRKLAKIGHNRC